MSPAPDPSKHDDLSVNRVHGYGILPSTYVSSGGPSSSGLSAIKSRIGRGWMFLACEPVLIMHFSHDLSFYELVTSSWMALFQSDACPLLFCLIGGHPLQIFKQCSAMDLGKPPVLTKRYGLRFCTHGGCIQISMLKPGEYEIWRMRIEQYIQMIDYALWEVIENGATLPKTKIVEGVMTEMPITTVEEKA
ncbi:hypothetical protein Tco_0908016 [Tanacetum coccineum]|uniref:Uncharacterized protein n=1 Tax=Tanacetum coccineum TaxID=301880 RepID=A0ABQ5CKY8_9ASTR